MGPLVIPLISLGAQLLAKRQEDEDFKKLLPQQILANRARELGAPTAALDTQMAIDKHDKGSAMDYAPTIASLVSAMGKGGGLDDEQRKRLLPYEQRTGSSIGYNPFTRYGV